MVVSTSAAGVTSVAWSYVEMDKPFETEADDVGTQSETPPTVDWMKMVRNTEQQTVHFEESVAVAAVAAVVVMVVNIDSLGTIAEVEVVITVRENVGAEALAPVVVSDVDHLRDHYSLFRRYYYHYYPCGIQFRIQYLYLHSKRLRDFCDRFVPHRWTIVLNRNDSLHCDSVIYKFANNKRDCRSGFPAYLLDGVDYQKQPIWSLWQIKMQRCFCGTSNTYHWDESKWVWKVYNPTQHLSF